MSIYILSLLVFIFIISSIFFRQNEKIILYSFFKPLTTILIILISFIVYYQTFSRYSYFIILALFFSLLGDLFLIKEKFFLYGLSSFLIAHILFTYSFTSLFGFQWNIPLLFLLLFIGLTYLFFLRKYLNIFFVPVVVYIIAIIIMNWQAVSLYLAFNSTVFIGISLASLLFSFSDSIIAYNKFVKKFNYAEILILSTYWIAIYIFTVAGLFI